MAKNPQYWDVPKRYLRVDLYKGEGSRAIALNTLTEDARVKFNTVAAVSGALTEANITISGLSVKTMFDVATSTTQWVKNWVQNHIVLSAGTYINHSKIFDGTIMEAQPSLDNADYSITVKAITGFGSMTQPVSYTFAGSTPVATIASKIAADNGLAFVDGLQNPNVRVSDFSVRETNIVDTLRQLSQACLVDLYIDMGRLYLKPIGQAIVKSGDVIHNH